MLKNTIYFFSKWILWSVLLSQRQVPKSVDTAIKDEISFLIKKKADSWLPFTKEVVKEIDYGSYWDKIFSYQY